MIKKIGSVILEIVFILSCLLMPITNVKAGEAKEWTICDENKLFEGHFIRKD